MGNYHQRFLVMPSHHEIIDTLRIFAHRADIERVGEAVHALRPFGDVTVLAMADALSDPDDYVRVMALEVLFEWVGDTEPALPATIRALDDADRIVRICAASVVSQHIEKANAAVPPLLKWIDGDDEHRRLTAAALILKIDPAKHDEVMAVLRGGMESDDTGIRCLAAWLLSGLRDLTPDALPLLQQMLADGDEFVRSVAAEELESSA
jgi:HEAT repeat protein